MAIAGVIFDMDGLLFDSERLYVKLYKQIEPDFGIELPEQAYIDCVGTTMERTGEIILSCVGRNDFDYPAFKNTLNNAFDRYREEYGLPLMPGAAELVRELHRRGLPLGVASSTRRYIVDDNLAHAGLEGYIRVVTGGDEIGRGKPAPDIYVRTAAELGVRCEAVLVFEDSEAGILAASAAGMRVAAVPDLKRPPEAVLAKAFRVYGSLPEALGEIEELLE